MKKPSLMDEFGIFLQSDPLLACISGAGMSLAYSADVYCIRVAMESQLRDSLPASDADILCYYVAIQCTNCSLLRYLEDKGIFNSATKSALERAAGAIFSTTIPFYVAPSHVHKVISSIVEKCKAAIRTGIRAGNSEYAKIRTLGGKAVSDLLERHSAEFMEEYLQNVVGNGVVKHCENGAAFIQAVEDGFMTRLSVAPEFATVKFIL